MSEPLALYVHIPFCTKKCGYCDFNSHAGQEHLIPAYAEALAREAALWSLAWRGRTFETLFFGGGTPSLMPLDGLALIFAALRQSFDFAPDAEVTLEANPGTVDEAYLRGLRALGVNRLSIGVQSLDDDELVFLDRIHSAEEARVAFRAARAAGFDNVNLDLIFGLPRQPLASWRRSLEGGLALEPDHLSLYALTVEERTPLARYVAQGRVPAPDPDVQADMYAWTVERMAAAGYEHYEISNWARPGMRCRHNLTYWRNGQWLGLGAGAHSHVRGCGLGTGDSQRFAVVAPPGRYVALVNETWAARNGHSPPDIDSMLQITYREDAGPALAAADTLILGLRLTEGVDLAEFERRFGAAARSRHEPALHECLMLGLLEREDGRVRLSDRGRLMANEVFVRLLPG